MKESLTNRVSRIVSGSLNSLVDAVENAVPETVMEEAIREIEGAIDEVRAQLGRVLANKHLANTRLIEENTKHRDLSEKIELAVTEGRDDLAEAAIATQLDIEAQIPVLEATILESGNQEKELEGYIQALQAKKREMKNELREFRESREKTALRGASEGAATGKTGGAVERRVERAGSTFDRVMEKQTGIAARGLSTERKTAAQLAELENLARQNRVQERLAAIKSKTKGTGE